MEALLKRCLFDSSWEAPRERHGVLATRRNDCVPAILNTKTCSTYSWDEGCFAEPRETAGRTESKRCSQQYSEGFAGNCWQDRIRGPLPQQCCGGGKLVSSRSSSSWSVTRDINKNEERMTEVQNLIDRLQDGYRDKSIIKDLCSARSQKRWATSNCTEKLSVLRA